jgi:multimeric flavodoxin WrbA
MKGVQAMPRQPITVLRPVCHRDSDRARLDRALAFALEGAAFEILDGENPPGDLRGRRILFALALDEWGFNAGYVAMLRWIRSRPGCLEGCAGGVVVDGAGELYTKSVACELVLSANMAGCAFVGRPLVEATASLSNFETISQAINTDPTGAYLYSLRALVGQLESFSPLRLARPSILALHASSHETSNTMALWRQLAERLKGCDITEIGLRNGAVADCSGCPYTMCRHFGEREDCFYGGVVVQQVYPAIGRANALVMLCPNYNDALSANLTACINRLTALFRKTGFFDKALFGIVVSGYSGGDIVARQLIASLCMNKTFYLPARFAMLETANKAGSAMKLAGIERRLDAFAQNILSTLYQP